jgi:hypothetical protein
MLTPYFSNLQSEKFFESDQRKKMGSEGRDEKNRQKWDRIMEKGVDNVLKEQPEAFLRRARRGIPTEYRYESSLY